MCQVGTLCTYLADEPDQKVFVAPAKIFLQTDHALCSVLLQEAEITGLFIFPLNSCL